MNVRNGLFFLALTLAACGGGGGSASVVTSFVATPAPGAPIQQTGVQRSLASASLFDTQAFGQFAQFGSGGSLGTSPSSVLRRTLDAVATRNAGSLRSTLAVCNVGVEIDLTPSGPTALIHERTFYDAACTQLFQDINLAETLVGSSSVSLSGTETQYTRAGAVFAYDTLSGSLVGAGTTSAQVSLQIADAASNSAPVRAMLGLSCNIGVTSQNCGSGGVEHLASISQDFGATIAATVFIIPVPGQNSPVTFTGTAAAYKGGLNALALAPGPFPIWSVSGGTLIGSASLSGGLSFNAAGILSGGQLTFTDPGSDATVTVTAAGQPLVISGVVKQSSTGQTKATFTLDINGNGTITFSDGSTAVIIAWQIVS